MASQKRKRRKKRYPSNLSDGAWNYLKELLPLFKVGRPRTLSIRRVIDAILYVVKTGCQWRQLPRDFPAWTAVYYYFHRWTLDGTWTYLHNVLHARLREKCGRHKHPTAGCLDSQSVKGTAIPGERSRP